MTVIKIPYQTLIQHDDNGVVRGAHHQFRRVILNEVGVRVAESLLPAVPFGTDPDFPASTLLGQATEDALALAELRAAAVASAEQTRDEAVAARDEAVAARDEAVAARDAALSQRDAAVAEKAAAVAAAEEAIADLQAQISALTAQPERPPGKWWKNSAKFLQEFTAEELLAIHTSQVPLVVQLLMTLLAWTDEVWSSDQRIIMGLQALVSLGVLTPERRAAILAE
jgi:hypothetical protein